MNLFIKLPKISVPPVILLIKYMSSTETIEQNRLRVLVQDFQPILSNNGNNSCNYLGICNL